MHKKKIKMIICGVILASIFNTTVVFATPTAITDSTQTTISNNTESNNSESNNSESNNSETDKSENLSLLDKKNKLVEEVQILDSEIESNINKIDETTKDIEQTEISIDNLKKKNEQTKKDIEKKNKLLGNRVKALANQNPVLDYIDLLCSSRDLTDLVKKVNYIGKVIETDKKQIVELKETKENLEKEEKEINEKKDELNKTKEDLEKINEDLSSKKEEQVSLINELNSQIYQNLNIQYNDQYLSQVREYLKDSDGCPQAVEIASQFLGVPYVWGGTTPSGFDCSGLTQYVYNQLGKSIPRVSEDQQNFGIDVPLDMLKPGDLLFVGRPAHHVTIYAGNGLMIHAPHTGDVVKFAPVNFNSITSAKRIIY